MRRSPLPPARPGLELVGRYRLERVLGEGGIGVVWEAVDLSTRERVAIKTIRPELIAREDLRRRLVREAKIASGMRHPHLVRIDAVISGPDGAPALVMELLEGESLESRLAREGALSIAETARILLPAFAAIHAMHSRHIVHRDFKPANIYLTRDSGSSFAVKLLDFGFAKWIGMDQSSGQTNKLTASGAQVGTPYYMAPEQVLCEATIDQRADVFAAGVVLFECLTGKRPTEADNRGQVFKRILNGPLPSLGEVHPSAPGDLVALVDGMMARDVDRRVTSIEPALQLLRQHTDGGSFVDAPIRLVRHGRRLSPASAALAAVAPLVLMAFGGLLLLRSQAPPRPLSIAGMVWLAGGTFSMGQSQEAIEEECRQMGAACRPDLLEREKPERRMEVSPFYLDADEVTNGQFVTWLNTDSRTLQVVDDTSPPPHERRYVYTSTGKKLLDLFSEDTESARDPQGIRLRPLPDRLVFEVVPGKEQWPVIQVTHDGAQLFCQSRGMRLPTEAEWEFAARGVSSRRYPWGDHDADCRTVVFGRDPEGRCSTLPRHPQPVGLATRDVTPEGVRHLGGNVAEWVADWFASPTYGPCRTSGCKDERVDPPPGISPDEQLMIVRGASFASSVFMRTSRRARFSRTSHKANIGFRCAVSQASASEKVEP